MRRGVLLSVLLHMVLIFVMWVSLPEHLFPDPEIKAIEVRLVMAPDVKKEVRKKEPKKVRTQQSAAPREAAKPKPKPKPQPKPKDKKRPSVVKEKQVVKKEPPKDDTLEKPKKEEVKKKEEPNKQPLKPQKLDKSEDKKNVIKEQDKTAEPVENPEDFMKALSFVEDLKAKQNAMMEGEKTEETTINLADQADIAVIRKHIERNWYKPAGIAGEYVIHVEVRVNRDGTLKNVKVVKSSGKAFFDNSLLRAVRKSVPLPIPPDKYDKFKVMDLHFSGN